MRRLIRIFIGHTLDSHESFIIWTKETLMRLRGSSGAHSRKNVFFFVFFFSFFFFFFFVFFFFLFFFFFCFVFCFVLFFFSSYGTYNYPYNLIYALQRVTVVHRDVSSTGSQQRFNVQSAKFQISLRICAIVLKSFLSI